MLRRLPTLSARRYQQVALAALILLTVIVFTGAAVRLTGSGLGCPNWPKCGDGIIAPLESHAWIEYGNRLFSGLVTIACIAAGLLAWRRRPFRRDLAYLGALLPLGVVGQAVLGGLTVLFELRPGFVMGHFLLSMLILIAAVALYWRARHEPGERPLARDRTATWAVRALVPLGGLAVFMGTTATAAGPHAGSRGTGEVVPRLGGGDSLDALIHWHGRTGTLLGLAALGAWFLVRRRGGDAATLRWLTVVCLLVAAQGLIGFAQYELGLPSGIVWVHVVVATATWVAILFAVAAAGRLAPAPAVHPAAQPQQPQPQPTVSAPAG